MQAAPGTMAATGTAGTGAGLGAAAATGTPGLRTAAGTTAAGRLPRKRVLLLLAAPPGVVMTDFDIVVVFPRPKLRHPGLFIVYTIM